MVIIPWLNLTRPRQYMQKYRLIPGKCSQNMKPRLIPEIHGIQGGVATLIFINLQEQLIYIQCSRAVMQSGRHLWTP